MGHDVQIAFADCPILQADGWPGTERAFESALSALWGAPVPSEVGEMVPAGAARILRIAPRRFWLLGKVAGDPGGLSADLGSLVSLDDGRVSACLEGPRARRWLEEFMAIDWDDPAYCPGRAVQSGIHRIAVCVIRLGADRFELIVPRSFARAIAELA